jgi:phthalate 4,5-cis-dihydrodiol dehydrogenase
MLAALLVPPDIQVAAAADLHAEHVAMAAAGGKHVIVEKPTGLTLRECDGMIAAAEAADVRLIVGHTASLNPAVQKMRQMVASFNQATFEGKS